MKDPLVKYSAKYLVKCPKPYLALSYTAVLLLLANAKAAEVQFSVAYQSNAGDVFGSSLARAAINNWDWGKDSVSVALSNRALELGYNQSLALAPLGAASTHTNLAITQTGGLRLSSSATAGLGPIALALNSAYFSAPITDIDPMAAWALAPTDLRSNGLNGDLTLRYRVNRNTIAVVGGELGAQNQVFGGVEGRREFFGPSLMDEVVPEETSEPDVESANSADTATQADETTDAAPQGDLLGTLTWRAGARAGRDVLGLSGGLSYATESGITASVDTLIGANVFGLVGSLNFPSVLGEESQLKLYAAYEPWRSASTPFRTGLDLSVPVGAGTFEFNLSGGSSVRNSGVGQSGVGQSGFGAKASYRFSVGSFNYW